MSTAEIPPTTPGQLITADILPSISAELKMQGRRCELVRGELRTMSPASDQHGQVANEIAYHLNVAVRSQELGVVFIGETGFVVGREPDSVLVPDVSFVRADRIKEVGVTRKYFPEAPTLAIEVVSPNDVAENVHAKAKMWIEAGCQAVWLLWPDSQTVTDYRSLENIRVLTAEQTLEGGDVVPGFAVPVGDLFAGLQ